MLYLNRTVLPSKAGWCTHIPGLQQPFWRALLSQQQWTPLFPAPFPKGLAGGGESGEGRTAPNPPEIPPAAGCLLEPAAPPPLGGAVVPRGPLAALGVSPRSGGRVREWARSGGWGEAARRVRVCERGARGRLRRGGEEGAGVCGSAAGTRGPPVPVEAPVRRGRGSSPAAVPAAAVQV